MTIIAAVGGAVYAFLIVPTHVQDGVGLRVDPKASIVHDQRLLAASVHTSERQKPIRLRSLDDDLVVHGAGVYIERRDRDRSGMVGAVDWLFPTHGHLLWLIAALALAACELLTGGFVLLWFAVGAAAAALASWFGASFNTQLMVLGITALLLFAGSRTIFRRVFMARGLKVRTNAAAMIGRAAEVLAEVGPGLAQGTVKVNGEVWNARSTGAVLPPGTRVVIEEIDGLLLLVRHAG